MVEGLAIAFMGELRLRSRRGAVAGAFAPKPPSSKPSLSGGTSLHARLWQAGNGGASVVLKRIHNGGTHSPKELKDQLDYLFSKAAWCGGNAVAHDDRRNTLTPLERKDIVDGWQQDWARNPKNGHTTHLLLSFPAEVSARTARIIAEDWLADMFETPEERGDQWAYVAMRRTLLLTLAGLIAGAAAGVPLASLYLNLAIGLGLNGGEAFSFVTEFAGMAALRHGPWPVATRIVGAAALIFAVAAFLLSLRQELTRYGEARFQSKAELKAAGLLRPVGEGLVFAKLGKPATSKPYISARYDAFPHCLVVAPTRAGKGVGYVIPNMLLFPGSTVVLDVKGEIFEATSRHRVGQGDRVFRFAPFDFDHASHRYNPLERVARIAGADRRYTELAKIADYFLTVSDRGNAGDFLTEGRELFVAAGLLAIERGRPTIGEIVRILFGQGATQDHYRAMGEEVEHMSARRTFAKFAGYSDRTLSSHASVLSGAGLTLWNNPAIDRATAANDFTFATLRRRPQSIYLVVNADDLKTLAPLIRLFFGELIATLRASLPDRKEEPWPVMVMLDEFDQLGPMPIVEQALKQLAGHGARVSIITQSIPGLDNIYGENVRLSLESAAGMKLFLSPNEKKTAAEVSEGLGKTTKLAVSDSHSRDNGFRARRSVSRRMEERPLMTPDEIRRLSPERVILIPERQNPILAERIVYYRDPTFRALVAQQIGPLPYPPAEIAEVAALRAELSEIRAEMGAIRYGGPGSGLAKGVASSAELESGNSLAEPSRANGETADREVDALKSSMASFVAEAGARLEAKTASV